MKLPVVLCRALPLEYERRWHRYYVLPSDRNRAQEEGIWRRTQRRENASESGWRDPSDQRRRIVYYLHDFDIRQYPTHVDLVMHQVYLFYSLSLPLAELSADLRRIKAALVRGGWSRQHRVASGEYWTLADLSCTLSTYAQHPEDIEAGRELPKDYASFDLTIRTESVGAVEPRLPWRVLSEGMRIKDERDHPCEIPSLSLMKNLTPFHVEVGCGVSIEAGIPALQHLHELYRVTDLSTGQFIFGGSQDDLVERLLLAPPEELTKLGELFRSSFLAEPTQAHKALLALRDAGHLLAPVMTNNFDGLMHRIGLQEVFLRRYDEAVPVVEFHPEAKCLLVIGSHADRRRVQARARMRGLPVVYLDPEGYWVDDRFVAYPLEGPRADDFLCRDTATSGLLHFCAELGIAI